MQRGRSAVLCHIISLFPQHTTANPTHLTNSIFAFFPYPRIFILPCPFFLTFLSLHQTSIIFPFKLPFLFFYLFASCFITHPLHPLPFIPPSCIISNSIFLPSPRFFCLSSSLSHFIPLRPPSPLLKLLFSPFDFS